ncbi:MAG: UvrD-helicase domain-containing protein [Acidobacteria bacterium]|nr:UvrD-helicase domain-containing protein [Acidobacteriota bacterium]
MPLTGAQQKALRVDRDVLVMASAGSGKTTLLVERVLEILQKNGFHPEQILALTFTEAAAAQMKEGIRQAVEERARQQSGDGNPWPKVYPRLSSARITTIHGFCAGLLHEYPLEAGINPLFTVLSEAEQKVRVSSAIHHCLLELSRNLHPALEKLLHYLSRFELEQLLFEMLLRRDCIEGFETAAGVPPDRFKERFQTLEQVYLHESMEQLLGMWEWDRLRQLLMEIPEALLALNDSYARRCSKQLEIFSAKEESSAKEFLMRSGKSLEGRVTPSLPWRSYEPSEELKRLWNLIKRNLRRYALEHEWRPQENLHFQEALAALSEVFSQACCAYAQAKSSDSALDFDDLLRLAAQVAGDKSIREKLIHRFLYILVDEFQDTDWLQWNLLQSLRGPHTNFFCVGDLKQSIYRFRDADVTIFRTVREKLEKTGAVVQMGENHRSTASLVEFFNRIFKDLFLARLDYEAIHQKMESLRPGAVLKGPPVLGHFYQLEEDLENPEPDLVAAWISQIVEQEGCRFSDIALLLRARTRLKQFEEALREAGIPFQTAAGAGFYQRQEIFDLLNLLRFLANRADDASLVAVLRSPFFNCSDEEIFLASLHSGTTLWSRLQATKSQGSADRPSLSFSRESLEEWWRALRQLPIAGLLKQALEDTGYVQIVNACAGSAQATENIAKFIDLARDFEKHQSRSLREFVRFVSSLLENDTREAEAVLPESLLDAVQIHTVHGAKGLQFPIVLLPELGTPLSSLRRNMLFCETFRQAGRRFLALKIANPSQGYAPLEHPAFTMLQRLDEYRQIAEEKRLLYVAVTRARDRLLLLGKHPAPEAPLSYAHWIYPKMTPGELVGAESISALSRKAKKAGPPPSARSLDRPPGRIAVFPKKVWTATELTTYAQCAYRFYLGSVQGLEAGEPLDWDSLRHKPTLAGSAIHELLEKPAEAFPVYLQKIEQWEKRHRGIYNAVELAELRSRILSHLQRTLEHPLMERMRHAERLFSERPFHVRVGVKTITGVIDKMFQEKSGRWVVVDFKTNQVGAGSLQEEIRRQSYDLQVQIYLWAASQILSNDRLEGFLFFTGPGALVPIPYGEHIKRQISDLIAGLPEVTEAGIFRRTVHEERCSSCCFLNHSCPGALRAPEQQSFW